MHYDPETKTLYNSQADAKILGLPKVRRLPRPGVNQGKTATQNAMPHDEGGEWVLGWTITTVPIEDLRATAQLDRFEFARRAAAAGFITYVEAAQWAAGNLIPSAVQTIIDGLPAEQQGPVTLDVLAIPVIRRTGNLMPALAAAFQTDDAGLDALFGLT
jgi:hypothetical protein